MVKKELSAANSSFAVVPAVLGLWQCNLIKPIPDSLVHFVIVSIGLQRSKTGVCLADA
jgi:hypothetical protein